MKSKSAWLLVAAVACSTAVSAQQKYPKRLFAVNQMHIDSVRAPDSLGDIITRSSGSAVAAAIAGYLGIHPAYLELANALAPKVDPRGEETYYTLYVPDGYTFCGARINTRSIIAGGDRNPVMNAGSGDKFVSIYTWTPVNRAGGGSASVEADVQIVGIKPEFLTEFRNKGVCKAPAPAPSIVHCAGNPCPPAVYGSLAGIGDDTPDLTKEDTGWGR